MRYSFIFLLVTISIFAGNVLEKEIYYTQDNQLVGEKQYLYNSNYNIIETYTIQKKGVDSRTFYFYHEGKVVLSEEYAGENSRIYYSVYIYNGARLFKKFSYDNDERLLFVNEYVFDSKGRLSFIKSYTADNNIDGIREFIYDSDRLVEERFFDTNKKLFLKKIFTYEDGLIKRIDFFDEAGNKIRVVKRVYSNKTVSISPLGYRDNFYDFK